MCVNLSSSKIKEKKLVELFKNASNQAFGELYVRYYDRLVNYCMHYNIERDEAKDIVQDVFLQIWEKRTYLDVNLCFSGYLHAIARNKVLQKFRQFDVHSRYAQHLICNAKEINNDTEKSIEYNDYANLLNSLIQDLSPRQREIFKLSRVDKLTYKEISTLLNITVLTVQTHVYIVLKKIKKFLENHDIVYP